MTERVDKLDSTEEYWRMACVPGYDNQAIGDKKAYIIPDLPGGKRRIGSYWIPAFVKPAFRGRPTRWVWCRDGLCLYVLDMDSGGYRVVRWCEFLTFAIPLIKKGKGNKGKAT